MSLTSTEEALVRELLAQQAAILSLAENEATIQSKLGATKVTLSDLTAATALGDSDLLLVRQGTNDKSIAGAVIKALGNIPDNAITQSKMADNSVGTNELINSSVTYAKMQTVSAGKVLGRDTSGSGVVQELPLAVTPAGFCGLGTATPDRSLVVNGEIGLSYNATVSAHGIRRTSLATEYFAEATSSADAVIHKFTGFGGVEKASITQGGIFSFNSGYGSSSPAFGCRGWVNFNGTATVAVRGSGGVSSVADNGVGNYTVNFSTALPDTNYCVLATAGGVAANGVPAVAGQDSASAKTTSSVQIRVSYDGGAGPSPVDVDQINVSIFR